MAKVFKLDGEDKIQVHDLIRIIPMDKFRAEEVLFRNKALQEKIADTYLWVVSIDSTDPDVLLYTCETLLTQEKVDVPIVDSDIDYVVRGAKSVIIGEKQQGVPFPFPKVYDTMYDIKDMNSFLRELHNLELSVLMELQKFFLCLDTVVVELEEELKIKRLQLIDEYNKCISGTANYNFQYESAYKYLVARAEQNNEKYFEIVEDTYKVENGLLLIVYSDVERTQELYNVLIDVDTLQEIE